ncbi:MAG: hypothetical protein EP298_09780 [Gammaproteobacteria bacterium]|nr:MAG: hypothetical protein EP298_09780 [Gammaproteobacteria bacterium]
MVMPIDRLGESVSISSDGNTIAVGAPLNDAGGAESGLAKVFDWNGAAWVQRGSDLLGEAAGDESGFSVSLSADGSTLAIGAPLNDDGANNAGQVRIYRWNEVDLVWDQLDIDLDGENGDDWSGYSVSLNADGTSVAIGTFAGNLDDSGQVRVYQLTSTSETVTYTEGDGVVNVYPDVSINDVDDDYIESATVSITVATYQAAEDTLSFDNALATSIGVTGNVVGNVITFTSNTADTVTKSEYEQLLATITFSNSSENPNTTSRILHYIVNDGDVNSNIATLQIDVIGVNDPPEISLGLLQIGQQLVGDASGDNFGHSVSSSADGSRIAVGARSNDDNGANSGHTKVYELVAGSWVQLGATFIGEAAGDGSGIAIDLSNDGNRLAIGAGGNDDNGSNSGHVRIYEWDGFSWNQLGLDIDGETVAEASGSTVRLSGDGSHVIIGALSNSESASQAGQVRVYQWNGSAWVQKGLDIDGEAAQDRLGGDDSITINANGSRIAVGSRYNDGFASNAGHTRIFEWDGSAWVQLGIDIEGSAANAQSGFSVDLSADGNRIAVGTIISSEASVYEWNGSSWVQVGSVINGVSTVNTVSLSADGSRLAVGNPSVHTVKLYEYDGSDWVQLATDIVGSSNGAFGRSVSLSADGTQVVSGGIGTAEGYVEVYNLEAVEKSIDYTENDAATILHNAFTITDVDDVNLESATITITNYVAGEDVLSFGSAPVGITVTNVAPGTLLATGSATLADYKAFFDTVTYENSSDNPDVTQREIEFIGNDGDVNSNIATVYVNMTATNDAPDLDLISFAQLGADIDGEASGDQSGRSVSFDASGSRVAIGAFQNSAGGHVRVYDWDGSSWNQVGLDIDGEAIGDQSGYSVALSDDGLRLVVGAPQNTAGTGHVRIYEWDGSSWNQLGSDIDGENASDESGWSVATNEDGSIIAVGARLNADSGANSGHVRLYQYNGTAWVQLGSDIDGEAANDNSGYSVNLSDDGFRVAIGAISNDGAGTDRGHVRIYDYNGTNWVQVGADIDGEADSDQSGISVSLSSDGSRIAIGAHQNNGTGALSGHVRIYEYNGAAWVQVGADIDGEAAGDNSGISVSLSADGSIIAIGAIGNSDNGANSGHVRIYRFDGTSWQLQGASTVFGSDIDGEAASDFSGFSVSLNDDGTRVAIGAPINNSLTGHVRVYELVSNSESITVTENDPAAIIYPEYLISDVDDDFMESATVSITLATYQAGEDVLSFNSIFASSIGVTGNVVGNVITFTSDAPNDVTKVEYEQLLATVTYQNTSENPNATPREVHYMVNDGDTNSNISTVFINVTPVNDPPELLLGNYQQLGLDIDGEAIGDFSGISVDLSDDGSIMAIGATGNNGFTGHVRVYQWDGSTWNQLGADIDGEAALDDSGRSVSLSSDGTRLAIGAELNDGNGAQSGHTRVYEWDGSSWNQLGSDIDGAAAGDQSGFSVDLSADGDRLVIGSWQSSANGLNSGQTSIFEWNGTAWVQLGSAIDGEAIGDSAGSSVTISSDGNRIAIGANANDAGGIEVM